MFHLIQLISILNGGRTHLRPQKTNRRIRKNDRGTPISTQWAKAVIFTEKTIIANKGCKPKFEELIPYFKAYESRDETIGRGTHVASQGLF